MSVRDVGELTRLEDTAVLHHKLHFLEDMDVLWRAPRHRDAVRVRAGGGCAPQADIRAQGGGSCAPVSLFSPTPFCDADGINAWWQRVNARLFRDSGRSRTNNP